MAALVSRIAQHAAHCSLLNSLAVDCIHGICLSSCFQSVLAGYNDVPLLSSSGLEDRRVVTCPTAKLSRRQKEN